MTSASDAVQTPVKAQISLIKDKNGNKLIDASEVLNTKVVTLAKDSRPQLTKSTLSAGDYFVYVFPSDYVSDANYNLQFATKPVVVTPTPTPA